MLAKTFLVSLLAGAVVAKPDAEMTQATTCETATTTAYGINTQGHEQSDWLASIQTKYLTEGNTWTGDRVPVFTSVITYDGTTMTGAALLETGILQAEGYEIVSSVVTVTDCETSPTATGSGEDCMPHGDHWHCPEGVAQPTYAPDGHGNEHEDEGPSDTECVAHGDHWHCPDGVPEPTSDPDNSSTAHASDHEGVGAIPALPGIGRLALVALTVGAGAHLL